MGDKLSIRYYLVTLNVKVVGVLEKETDIALPRFSMNVDGFMIFPDVNITNENQQEYDFHNTIMMMEKDEGYIGINSLKDFPKAIETLKKIRTKYDFAINVENVERTYQYLQETETNTDDSNKKIDESKEDGSAEKIININNSMSGSKKILLKLLIGLGLICIAAAIWMFNLLSAEKEASTRSVVYKTKKVLTLVANVFIMYGISYFLCLGIFYKKYGNFNPNFILYSQAYVRLGLIVVTIIASVIICRNISRHYKEDSVDD